MAATLTSTGVNFSDGSTINGTVNNTIGSYALLGRVNNSGTVSIGGTLAGSSLRPIGLEMPGYSGWPTAGSAGGLNGAGQGTTMSGTWRCMGYMYNQTCCGNVAGGTLWVRIS